MLRERAGRSSETVVAMIERLPLEIFGGDGPESDMDAEKLDATDERAQTPDVGAEPDAVDEATEANAPELARCQWCGSEFDDALNTCPECGAAYRKLDPPDEDASTVTCQWCLTEFERDRATCPNCDAMVVIPGQYVLGQNDPVPDFAGRGLLAQRAQSRQLLVGMMAGGGLDSLAAGLIGLAFTLFDDD